MESPVLFVLTVLVILGTPGPTNTLLATSGAAVGWRCSLALLPAESCGYLISILFLGLVLGPVVAGSPAIATALRLLVGAYLLMLSLKLWHAGTALPAERKAVVRPGEILVTTLLNPKAIIFALGVVPFGSAHVLFYLMGFIAMAAAIGFCWVIAGAAMGQVARTAGGHERLVPRVGGAVIALFALVIVVSPFVR